MNNSISNTLRKIAREFIANDGDAKKTITEAWRKGAKNIKMEYQKKDGSKKSYSLVIAQQPGNDRFVAYDDKDSTKFKKTFLYSGVIGEVETSSVEVKSEPVVTNGKDFTDDIFKAYKAGVECDMTYMKKDGTVKEYRIVINSIPRPGLFLAVETRDLDMEKNFLTNGVVEFKATNKEVESIDITGKNLSKQELIDIFNDARDNHRKIKFDYSNYNEKKDEYDDPVEISGYVSKNTIPREFFDLRLEGKYSTFKDSLRFNGLLHIDELRKEINERKELIRKKSEELEKSNEKMFNELVALCPRLRHYPSFKKSDEVKDAWYSATHGCHGWDEYVLLTEIGDEVGRGKYMDSREFEELETKLIVKDKGEVKIVTEESDRTFLTDDEGNEEYRGRKRRW